jgi:hypothetical protein
MPATDDIKPVDIVTLRTRLLEVSAMYTLPSRNINEIIMAENASKNEEYLMYLLQLLLENTMPQMWQLRYHPSNY